LSAALRVLGVAALVGGLGGCRAQATNRQLEVELAGRVLGERGDGHRVVFVATEPCEPARLEHTHTVAMAFLGPQAKEGRFETEASAHEGLRFFLCGFALDAAEQLVAFGQYAHNPIIVPASTQAEVELEDLDLVLTPVEPRSLPPGRYRVR
jgi:hypothetical protein